MNKLDQHIEFVKSQVDFQARQVTRFASDVKRSALHSNAVRKFSELLVELEEIKQWLANNPNGLKSSSTTPTNRLSLSWEEVEGLPQELLEELSLSETDKTEFTIVSLINEMGGVTSLDRLLVALFRSSGEVTKRNALNARLYRMAQKDLIFSVPGKKGVYSTTPISEEDAAKLN